MALARRLREWAVGEVKGGRSVQQIADDLHTTPAQVRWALKATEVAEIAKADRASRGRFSPDQLREVFWKNNRAKHRASPPVSVPV